MHNGTTQTIPVASAQTEWLTLRQASQRSNLGKTTLYSLLKNGRIKGKVFKTRRENISGKRMILAASLDAYLSEPEPA